MIKKSGITAAALMVVLSASLVACGGKSSDATSDSTASVNMTVAIDQAQSSDIGAGTSGTGLGETGAGETGTDTVNAGLGMTADTVQIAGTKTGNRYENALFNLYAEIPDTYIIYADEDLGQEYESQEEIKQALAPGNVNYMDLVAQDGITSENIQILITHATSMKDKGKTPDDWLATSMESFKKSLASQGATDIAAEIATIKVAGEEMKAINISCTLSDKQIEQQFFYKISGDYVMMIALSATQGRIPVLQGFFYGG